MEDPISGILRLLLGCYFTAPSLILKKSGVLGSDQSLSQLIGAGGLLHAAADALNSGNDVVDVSALNERG